MKESKIVNKRQGTRDFANLKQAQQSHKDVVHAVTDQKNEGRGGQRGNSSAIMIFMTWELFTYISYFAQTDPKHVLNLRQDGEDPGDRLLPQYQPGEHRLARRTSKDLKGKPWITLKQNISGLSIELNV